MQNSLILAAAAALTISAAGIAAAKPVASHAGSAPVKMQAHNLKLKTLYDQSADNSAIGIVSQKFEKEYATYTSQGADDFVVPAGATWTISEVDASGEYFNGSGPAKSENVFFYASKGKGKPGKLVASAKSIAGADSSGVFAITLPTPVKLTAGTYFVSVEANLAFSTGGEWGWNTTTTVQTGSPAYWVNKGDGLGTGCTKYKVEDVCIVAGQGPDQIFTLLGSSKS